MSPLLHTRHCEIHTRPPAATMAKRSHRKNVACFCSDILPLSPFVSSPAAPIPMQSRWTNIEGWPDTTVWRAHACLCHRHHVHYHFDAVHGTQVPCPSLWKSWSHSHVLPAPPCLWFIPCVQSVRSQSPTTAARIHLGYRNSDQKHEHVSM